MARRNTHSFKRHEKELKRKKKAEEKLARKQGKTKQISTDADEQKNSE